VNTKKYKTFISISDIERVFDEISKKHGSIKKFTTKKIEDKRFFNI